MATSIISHVITEIKMNSVKAVPKTGRMRAWKKPGKNKCLQRWVYMKTQYHVMMHFKAREIIKLPAHRYITDFFE